MSLATIILAAGMGKRMNDVTKSKVMFEVCGKPSIEYVTETALAIWSEKIVVIVWFQKEQVMDFIKKRFDNNPLIEFAVQSEQLWTWHAVAQAESNLSDFSWSVAILSWDVPLLKPETMKNFITYHELWGYSTSLISCQFENPTWYWRIIRDSENEFIYIKEEKDAWEEEKKVKEINSWIYACDCKKLFESLKTIDNQNAQNEYYLTDIFSHFRKKWEKLWAYEIQDSLEISWINTIDQLKNLEEEFMKK